MPKQRVNPTRDSDIHAQVRQGFKSLAEIGEQYGISRQRVHQIYLEVEKLEEKNDEVYIDRIKPNDGRRLW